MPTGISQVLKGYAAIVFLDNVWAGLLCLLATFWYPVIGLCGLLAGLSSYFTASILHLNKQSMSLLLLNSTLVGLSIGAFFPLNGLTLFILFIASVLTTFLTVALNQILHNLGNLPPLSLPFIIVAALGAFTLDSLPSIPRELHFDLSVETVIHPYLDGFFSTLGAILFTPHPYAGLLIFLALLLRSRYMSLLAISSFVVGTFVYQLIDTDISMQLLTWTGFNFVLTALALGGFFTIAGKASFAYAMAGAILTIPVIISIQDIMLIQGLPVMALPFVLVTLTSLLVLKSRQTLLPPKMAHMPAIPELNFERARLSAVRNGQAESISMIPPFFGEWSVYQGVNGGITHKPPWQYALDFFQLQDNKSFTRDGIRLEDYYCYNLPVCSPVNGTVVRIQNRLDDNRPGEVDSINNWGNFILIRLDIDFYVLLAHLQKNSIQVKEGDRVKPGSIIARCGNSGRSPQPHLHLQVQSDATLGSVTRPFHLSSVLLANANGTHEYKLVSIPEKGEAIQQAEMDDSLGSDLHLAVGHTMTFATLDDDGKPRENHQLHVTLSLTGQMRLSSSSGASSAFEEVNGVLGFYDRNNIADSFLDMWLLANGLTPLASRADSWRDQPSVVLFPLTQGMRFLAQVWFPLGSGINSHYSRQWNPDGGHWIQKGDHRLSIGFSKLHCQTESIIQPGLGIREIRLKSGSETRIARLIHTGIQADAGIPGWELDTPVITDTSEKSDSHPGSEHV